MKHFILIVIITFSAFVNLCAQTILGIDVSHYEGTIDWPQVKASGIVFAFAKATQGINVGDSYFLTNMTNGVNSGVIMGAYHFPRPVNNTAADEAQYFLSVAGSYIGNGFLPPVLDVENFPGDPSLDASFSSSALTTWVEQWMTIIEQQTGVAPIIYTNGYYATYLNSSVKNTYKLWIANPYTTATAPPVNIGGWPDWAFKQYDWYGTVPGINTGANVDLDVFNGDMTALNDLIISDSISPATAISLSGNWQTQNFIANFSDGDNTGGSGLEKSYYQVLDYDGAEWHANAQNGFFGDNFDSYNSSVWSVPTSSGTWNVAGGNLIQTDTSVNNSNIYTSLNQNLSNRYLYQFYAKIDPASYSTNEHRFGFHFFSDDGSLPNRGNSYFIYFRQETSTLEFFKVENDVFTVMKTVNNINTTLGQWNDYKIIFDRTTGKIDVYRDDIFLGSWTYSNVLTNSGDYISFRTGNCKVNINELKVYRSRYPSVTVSVGAAATNDIRYQNPDSATYSGKIKSIVNDVAGNLSSIVSKNIYVDWTDPSCVTVNDGNGNDIDATASMNSLSANWTTSSDPNSGISKYWYAIGTTAGATDVVNWTNNNLDTSVTNSTLSLTQGQNYYFSVKAENGAGLNSICSSDGIVADINTGVKENENAIIFSAQPNPFNENASIFFSQKTDQKITISLIDVLGKEVFSVNKIYSAGEHSIAINTDGLKLAKGVYTFRISSDKYAASLRVVKY